MASAAPTIAATHSAPTNIAVIKYWGKASVALNTPINSSVSVSLCQDDLKAITTIVASPDFEKDRLWLNGVEEDITSSARVNGVLSAIRARAGDRVASNGVCVDAHTLKTWKVHIVSRNTFPTAAGLASSAAGYACLVHTLADVFGVKETYPGELSAIARVGSGSACRSMYGGFVRWQKGADSETGRDSIAVQVADEKHWPELAVLIAVVSDKKKETGSTDGMKASVATSRLLAYRAEHVVDGRLAEIEEAYRRKDFPTFARITMQDSNQFHAVCLDTYPPIFYMNDISKRIIGLVHKLNDASGTIIAGYTFDAGPNAVIYTLKQHVPQVLATLLAHFPAPPEVSGPYVSSAEAEEAARPLIASLPAKVACAPADQTPGAVRHIYVTTAGDGPRVLPASEALADYSTGKPFVVADAHDKTYARAL